MQKKFEPAETQTALTLATLLDPRYKMMGFNNQIQAQASVKRLTAQCTLLMRDTVDTPPDTPTEEHPSTSAQAATANVENPPSTGNYSYLMLDKVRTSKNRFKLKLFCTDD